MWRTDYLAASMKEVLSMIFEVLAGGLVVVEMVERDGNLQHLKSDLDFLGAPDMFLVVLRCVQLGGDGCDQ